MKNIFKVFGIALLASSMLFVSCKKDSEATQKVDEAVDGVTVTFGSKTWTAETVQVMYSNEMVTFLAFEKTGAFDNFLAKFKANKDNKTYTDELEYDEDGDPIGFKKDNIEAVKYYTKAYNTADEGEPEDLDADWWAKSVTVNVTTLDADNAQFSATISAVMFNFEQWQNTLDMTVEQADTKSLSAVAKNVSMIR